MIRALLAGSAICAALTSPAFASDFKSLMEIEAERLQHETAKVEELDRAIAKVNAYANDSSLPLPDRTAVVNTTSAKMMRIINAHCLAKEADNFEECEPLFQEYIDVAAKVPNDSLERQERAERAKLDAEEAAAKQKAPDTFSAPRGSSASLCPKPYRMTEDGCQR